MKNIKLCTSSNGLACIEYNREAVISWTTPDIKELKDLGYISLYCGNSEIEPKYQGSEGMKDYYSFKSVDERTQFLKEVYNYKG